MKITEEQRGEVTILRLAGELTAETAEAFDRRVRDAFADRRRDFVVDLTKVTRVDSRGLESLTALYRHCEDELGLLRLCGADETFRKIIEITRLDHLLAVYNDVDEATASLA